MQLHFSQQTGDFIVPLHVEINADYRNSFEYRTLDDNCVYFRFKGKQWRDAFDSDPQSTETAKQCVGTDWKFMLVNDDTK